MIRIGKRPAEGITLSADELYVLMGWFSFVEASELDTLYDRKMLGRLQDAWDAMADR